MYDQLSLDRIAKMHPKVRDRALKTYKKAADALKGRALLRIAYGLRTNKEQDALYAQGRTLLFDSKGRRLGKVTNAKGGQSEHNYGFAWDIVLLVDKDGNGTFEAATWDIKSDFDGDKKSDWMEVVEIFKADGWEWGGDWKSFKDYPHFQMTFGHNWRTFKKLVDQGKVDAKGYVII